ncbi:MAG: hypothetical protein HXL12_00515 [Candidatus Nanosynbacter sp.]|nr:hypothetical protein [Candidatus Nanosynbacter sp.]
MKCLTKLSSFAFFFIFSAFCTLLLSVNNVNATNSINKIGWFNSHYSIGATSDFDISYNPAGSNPRVVDDTRTSDPINVNRQVIWFSLPQSGAVNKRSVKFDFTLTYWGSNSLFWFCHRGFNPLLDISVDGISGRGVVSNFSCNRFVENNNSIIRLSGSVFFSPEGGFVKDPYFRLFIGSSDFPTSSNALFYHMPAMNFPLRNLKLNYFDISNIELYSDPNTQFLNNLVVQNETIINQNNQLNNSINNQTEQQNQQFQQNKQEEKDREDKGKNDSKKLGSIFSFTVMNPFSPIFDLFAGGGCRPIPTIGKMLNKPNASYCPWFPGNIRSILTPVLGISAMMLIFGFVIRWLNNSGAI